MESIQQTFNGTTSFKSADRKITATISRNGDLVTNAYLEVTLKGGDKWVPNIGHAMVKSIELEIGGQRIDKWYAETLDLWASLTLPAEKEAGYKLMTGFGEGATDLIDDSSSADIERKYYIPLQFFFCRNVGLALPLIALQYHEVKFHVEFNSFATLQGNKSGTAATKDPDVALYVDYIYLDTDERRRFAQVSHEMLIEQVQFTGKETMPSGADSTKNIKLNFNHPVKELIIAAVPQSLFTEDKNMFRYCKLGKMKLMLNGHERFSERDAEYFSLVQPYQHHTRVPTTSANVSKNIYVYSFALRPEEHQPSGTCNFSRIDNATLSVTYTSGSQTANSTTDNVDFTKTATGSLDLHVYAMSYNVLRIMSGMGGLAFSN
jgi:hypothetical protein